MSTFYEQWQELLNNQTDDTFKKFWETYSSTETRIYTAILEDQKKQVSGVFQELADRYESDPVIFMGFLDGINTSLDQELALESITEESQLDLSIDFEKLYFNMHKAEADYLYSLSQWNPILTQEKRGEIEKAYKRSKTLIKEKTPGRNDPCPCGSGKKYKKCCGRAAELSE